MSRATTPITVPVGAGPGELAPRLAAPSLAGWAAEWAAPVGALLVLTIAAFYLADARVVAWVHAHGVDAYVRRNRWVQTSLRLPGHFVFTLGLALVLWRFNRWGWRSAGVLLLSGIVSGANWGIKLLVGRDRPDYAHGHASMHFDPLRRGDHGVVYRDNLSFPSGDVCLAFASAACLAALYPRWRVAIYGAACLVAVERVAENAHHVSDVVAAMAWGIVSFRVAWWAGRKMCPLPGGAGAEAGTGAAVDCAGGPIRVQSPAPPATPPADASGTR